MKVLITGINGFVGPYLAVELQKGGHSIFGLSRTGDGELKNDVVIVQGDLLDKVGMFKLLADVKPDVIFHLAAQSKPGYSFKEPEETFDSNVKGTLNLLECIRGLKNQNGGYSPRIMMAGTSEEYGLVKKEDLPLKEDSPFNPINPYAISKLACYYLSMMYVRSYDFDLVYMVPFSHIGPGQKEGFIVPDVCKQIVEIERGKKEPVLATGNLSVFRDYTDVRDMVKGYALLMEKGLKGERHNLCSGHGVQIEEIVDKLLSYSTKQIKHTVDQNKIRPSEMPILYGDSSKIKNLCGWKAEIPLEQTLKDSLEWWRNKYE
jgi:GDP-4-dehydro-6-deoxy-D-mannose reductase